MLEAQEIQDIVTAEALKQYEGHSANKEELQGVLDDFRLRARRIIPKPLEHVYEIFELCPRVNRQLRIGRLAPAVVTVIDNARQSIQDTLIEEFYRKKKEALGVGRAAEAHIVHQEMEAARIVGRIVPTLRRLVNQSTGERHRDPGPNRFSQHTIRVECNGEFDNLQKVLETASPDAPWQLFATMLPVDLREHFYQEKEEEGNRERIARAVEAVKEYRQIAEQLGPDALALFLISIGKAKEIGFKGLKKIIASHLGRFRVQKPTLEDIVGYPEALLRATGMKRQLFIEVRNIIYLELMKDGEPLNAEIEGLLLDGIKRRVRGLLEDKLGLETDAHTTLFDEVYKYYDEIFKMEKSSRLVKKLPSKEKGVEHAYPSLRQRIAMKEMEKRQDPRTGEMVGGRKLAAYPPGYGKTVGTFLAKEHVGAKKMLFICPPKVASEMPDRVKKYYKEPRPSVGMVKAGVTNEDIQKELEAEIVIVPYSMLTQDRVIDELVKQPFDFVAIDEAHQIRNLGGKQSENVSRIVNEVPNLYEDGYIMALTATPAPNKPSDLMALLKIYDRDTYGSVNTYRQALALNRRDPLFIRNAMLDFVLRLDEPVDWEQYIEPVEYSLCEEEREIYNSILDNEMLSPTQQLQALRQCILNPGMFALGRPVRSALFETTVAKATEYLGEHDAVLIVENHFKEGVTRDPDDIDGKAMYTKLIEYFEPQGVDIFLHDGDSSDDDRRRAIAASKRKGRKTIIFATAETMREGTNEFSHIHRGILLEPSYNYPDTEQLIGRLAREGNEDVKFACLRAAQTVHEGIYEHAMQKLNLIRIIFESGQLTMEDCRFLESDEGTDEKLPLYLERGRIYFGSAILNHLLSDTKKLARMLSYLTNRGEEELDIFFEEFGELFIELFTKNWEGSYSGNNSRFLAGLYQDLEQSGIMPEGAYVDLACGPMVLQQNLGLVDDDRKREFHNLDLLPGMMEAGQKIFQIKRPGAEHNMRVGSFVDMKGIYEDSSFAAVNCSQAIYCTKLDTRFQSPEKDERVKMLSEVNRILRLGGIFTMTLPVEKCSPKQFSTFVDQLEAHFGFEILRGYTGIASSTDDEDGYHFENYTVVCRKRGDVSLKGLDLKKLRLSPTQVSRQGKQQSDQPRAADISEGHVHTEFKINDVHLSFGEESAEKQDARQYKLMVERARKELQQIYGENGESFEAPDGDVLKAIRSKGIIITRFGNTYLFRFAQSTRNELVFPRED